jgi:hypothetical protein
MSAEGYRIVRHDFVDPEDRCAFCRRVPGKRLKTGLGYVLVDAAGNERLCGPSCVKSADNWGEPVLDLTVAAAPKVAARGDLAADAGAQDHDGEVDNEPIQPERRDADAARVRRYLYLRCEALVAHRWSASQWARDLWEHGSAAEDLTTALTLISRDAERKPWLTLDNLEDCYAFDRILQIALRKKLREKTRRLLASYLTQLRDNGSLSPRQVEIVSDVCAEYRLPAVRATVFSWRQAPSLPAT